MGQRKMSAWSEITKDMREAGFERSGTQCRDKIKKLKGEYRKVRDHNKQTGNERKTWHFYEAMNPVMADKPTSNPPVMIDTSLESQDNTADKSDEPG